MQFFWMGTQSVSAGADNSQGVSGVCTVSKFHGIKLSWERIGVVDCHKSAR